MKNKAQTAMEYLMTYGWAILIVIVVIAALYALGVFTPSGGVGCSPCFSNFAYVDYSGGTLVLTTGPQEIIITSVTGGSLSAGCTTGTACDASTDITIDSISTTGVVDIIITYNVTASGLAHNDTARIHN